MEAIEKIPHGKIVSSFEKIDGFLQNHFKASRNALALRDYYPWHVLLLLHRSDDSMV